MFTQTNIISVCFQRFYSHKYRKVATQPIIIITFDDSGEHAFHTPANDTAQQEGAMIRYRIMAPS